MAYGSFQARGQIGHHSRWPTPQPQPHPILAPAVTYTTAHGNTGSFTHGAGPGIEPASSWVLVGFVTAEPQGELQEFFLAFLIRQI